MKSAIFWFSGEAGRFESSFAAPSRPMIENVTPEHDAFAAVLEQRETYLMSPW